MPESTWILENPDIRRRDSKFKEKPLQRKVGEVRRSGFEHLFDPKDESVQTDAAAIRLDEPYLVPRFINEDDHLKPRPVTAIWAPTVGTTVCFSGRSSEERRCGPIFVPEEEVEEVASKEICFRAFSWKGDSGAPVWVEGEGVAVGILVTGETDPREPGGKAALAEWLEGEEEYDEEWDKKNSRNNWRNWKRKRLKIPGRASRR